MASDFCPAGYVNCMVFTVHMKRPVISVLVSLTCILMAQGCRKFELSPYQEQSLEEKTPGNLNALNVAKLKASEPSADDTVTVIYTGDSQRFYDRLEDLVRKANQLPDVDFLVLSGDIADFGLLQEYAWIQERLADLKMPYLCAIGNHDLTANQGDVYRRIFGDKNYSFLYKDYKFLFHDTNGREYGFNGTVPDMSWLGREVKDPAARWFVGVSHVPPFDGDFEKALEMPYKNLFNETPGFILSLHGHAHSYSSSRYYDDNVLYIISNSVQKEEFVLLKLYQGNITEQLIPY